MSGNGLARQVASREVDEQSARCLAAFREDQVHVEQDAAIETGIAQDGHGRCSAYFYQQMIGRGLHGPLNGGSERVKIVNVADNLLQHERDLAFVEFGYLCQKGMT